MNNKLILIDGSSMLSTAFYGTLPNEWKYGNVEAGREKIMKTKDGRCTNAVFGMVKLILKVIKEQNPQYLAVAWDISRDTFRRDLYPDYKANRSETIPELKSQFALAQETLEAMGIIQYAIEKFEADDIIGTLSKRFEDQLPVYVMTKDQDALQLISPNTKVWLNSSKTKDMVAEFHGELPYGTYNVPGNFFEFTEATFEHFYGLQPIQIIDSKAIEGDSSDNIPGVKGVGAKAAIPLLKEFGTIEAIYEYIEENEESEIKAFFKELGISRSPVKNLNIGKESAFLSKQLATIKTDMPEFDNIPLSALSLTVNNAGMVAKFSELEFYSLI